MRIWQKMVEGQRVRGVNENARHIVVEGPKDRGTFPQCNLGGPSRRGMAGPSRQPQLRARDIQPNFSGNRELSDQSVGPVALSHDAAPRKISLRWGWGCRSRIEELIRARHHIRTPAI